MLKRIVAIGPESTGKSTLCSQLADHYQTAWVQEYAREYLEANGTDYTFEDLAKIAAGQLTVEDTVAEKTGKGPVFIDTDLYVIKVWSEFVFNKCDNRLLTGIATRKYDLYLLCNTDLPWQKDALREYPDIETREKLFHHYKDAMIHQHIPWVEISGGYDERLRQAVQAVDRLLNR